MSLRKVAAWRQRAFLTGKGYRKLSKNEKRMLYIFIREKLVA